MSYLTNTKHSDGFTNAFTPSSYLNIPPAPDVSVPRWVISRLPVNRKSALRCDNGQWFIDGEPIYNTPYIKTGTRRVNAVALSVRAALWI